jgi:ketosteroid isomerase-like protein
MTTEAIDDTRFTVEVFEAFWARPDADLVTPDLFTPDVCAYWPGDPEPVRGFEAYRDRIADVLAAVPDLRLEVAESVSDGDVVFIRWIARGSDFEGRPELSGVDRILLEDGKVKENRIYFDPTVFDAVSQRH